MVHFGLFTGDVVLHGPDTGNRQLSGIAFCFHMCVFRMSANKLMQCHSVFHRANCPKSNDKKHDGDAIRNGLMHTA